MFGAKDTGALHLPGLFASDYEFWLGICEAYLELGQPGVRITDDQGLANAINGLTLREPLLTALGQGHWICVRAIAFDKGPETNWALGWHQDRTIAVKRQANVDGFGHWSIKQGIQHVEPPISLIERMVTLRMHFDPVGNENGPLLVAVGSHGAGKITDTAAASRAQSLPQLVCLADQGDGWLYRTSIVHASGRSTSSSRRRVLQLDFSCDELPGELEWRGID